MHIQGGYSAVRKGNPAICDNTDRLGRRYAQWSKSDGLIFMWNWKKPEFMETESKIICSAGWRNWGDAVQKVCICR